MINPIQSTKPVSTTKKAVKAVAAATVVTAGVAAGLAIGARKGVFNKETVNPILKKVNPYLQKAGSFINDKAEKVTSGVKNKVKNVQIKNRIVNSKVYKTVKSAFTTVANKIKGLNISGKVDTMKDTIESRLHPEKFQ